MPKPERFKEDSNFLNADSSKQEKAHALTGKSSLMFLLVLVCFSVFIYNGSLLNEFSYGDLSVGVENYYIKSFSYLPSVFDLNYFARFGEESYRPIVTLTYFSYFFLWGLSSEGFHLMNIILYLSVSILIFVLFRRIFNDNFWALFASVLFAIHPLTTGAVNAVGFREELLTAFFGLGALLFF